MKNKIALVTGGTGGLGTAICQAFAQEGATVIATYRGDEEKAHTWQAHQKSLGYHIHLASVDVSQFEACAKVVESLETQFSRIDILVNNAGITRDAQLAKMDLDQWQEVLSTNLNSLFNMSRHVLPQMIQHQYGRIINISSVNAQIGQFGQTNYSAAKSGIHGFTKALAREVAKKNITVNTVSPGYLETRMTASLPENIREKIIAQIPVARFGHPQEIARIVGFLAMEASSYITGSNILANGGQYLL